MLHFRKGIWRSPRPFCRGVCSATRIESGCGKQPSAMMGIPWQKSQVRGADLDKPCLLSDKNFCHRYNTPSGGGKKHGAPDDYLYPERLPPSVSKSVPRKKVCGVSCCHAYPDLLCDQVSSTHKLLPPWFSCNKVCKVEGGMVRCVLVLQKNRRENHDRALRTALNQSPQVWSCSPVEIPPSKIRRYPMHPYGQTNVGVTDLAFLCIKKALPKVKKALIIAAHKIFL